MKRTISTILALLLLFSMTACNQTATVSPPAPDTSALPAADNTPAEDIPATSSASSAPISVDEMLQEVNHFAEEENLQLIAGAEDAVREQYAQGDTDSKSIFDFLRSNGYCEAKPVEGIIVLSIHHGSRYSYSDTGTYKMTAFTAQLDVIDPQTGAVQPLRTFSSEETHSCSETFVQTIGGKRIVPHMQMMFDNSMTRMAAVLTMPDGAEHVGWIDESGQFTDVSQQVTTSQGDFGAIVKHNSPCFGPYGSNEYFYFSDWTTGEQKIMKVPMDNLSPEAVVTFTEDISNWTVELIRPNGDAKYYSFMGNGTYYDTSEQYFVPYLYFGDWISPSECVGTDVQGMKGGTWPNTYMLYRYRLKGKYDPKNHSNFYEDRIALIPYIELRQNWNPVVSSDTTQIAFLSKLYSGTDNATYLFIVPAEGGEPVKVPTSFQFSMDPSSSHQSDFATYLLKWDNGSPQIGEGTANPAQTIDNNSISGLQIQPEIIFEENQRETYTVTAEPSLNLRSGPDASYDKLGTIPTGRKITKIGETAGTSGWIVVEYRNENNEILYGWVSAEYIK